MTLKDHKDNFRSDPSCRLINTTKREICIISKKLLDRFNKDILHRTHVNQWKSTATVIDWFKGIQTRRNTTFLTFDVVSFYPSISKELLHRAIEFAKRYTSITPLETEIILHAKDTLLFHNNNSWHNREDIFDVTMGSYDGAETCELIGIYILDGVKSIIPKEDVGLYRDDGLAVIHKTTNEAENV